MTVAGLTIEPLGPSHDRTAFSCGSAALDRYLRQRAGQDMRRRIARVFVCTGVCTGVGTGVGTGPERHSILGFYTLSALSVETAALPSDIKRQFPRHPIPAALLGRVAVASAAQGQGIGRLLLADAVKRTISAGMTIGIYALVVDAKDDHAVRFYERFGFLPLPDRPQRLFLPLKQWSRDDAS